MEAVRVASVHSANEPCPRLMAGAGMLARCQNCVSATFFTRKSRKTEMRFEFRISSG